MEGDPGEGAVADGGQGEGAVADGGSGRGAERLDRAREGAARDGGPGHGHGAETVAGRGTCAAAYLGKGSDGDPSFEGAAARVGTNSGMDDDMSAG
jgi:hypothetical protein